MVHLNVDSPMLSAKASLMSHQDKAVANSTIHDNDVGPNEAEKSKLDPGFNSDGSHSSMHICLNSFFSILLFPYNLWLKIPPRRRLFIFCTSIMVLQIFDIISDLVLLFGMIKRSAVSPCRFCTELGYDFQYIRDWYRDPDVWSDDFDASCRASTPSFQSTCMNESGFLCDCNVDDEVTYKFLSAEVRSIIVYATLILVLIFVKETSKVIILILYSSSPRFRTISWFKYAMNSPFVLMSLWSASMRELVIDTMEAELLRKEQTFHILIDLVIEDIPQLIIPLWYFLRGKPSTAAIVSFIISCLSVLMTVRRAVKGLECSSNISNFFARIKSIVGMDVDVKPSPDVALAKV